MSEMSVCNTNVMLSDSFFCLLNRFNLVIMLIATLYMKRAII